MNGSFATGSMLPRDRSHLSESTKIEILNHISNFSRSSILGHRTHQQEKRSVIFASLITPQALFWVSSANSIISFMLQPLYALFHQIPSSPSIKRNLRSRIFGQSPSSTTHTTTVWSRGWEVSEGSGITTLPAMQIQQSERKRSTGTA